MCLSGRSYHKPYSYNFLWLRLIILHKQYENCLSSSFDKSLRITIVQLFIFHPFSLTFAQYSSIFIVFLLSKNFRFFDTMDNNLSENKPILTSINTFRSCTYLLRVSDIYVENTFLIITDYQACSPLNKLSEI